MRLRNPDGTVMEGSEKNVVAHGRSRTGGIGYDVIPADKWTRPVESTTPASVLYVNGKADLFIRPFFEEEFNDLAYEKTVNNAARGNPTIVKWVRVQQVPHAKIAVEGPGAARGVRGEEPFTVQQTQGSSLGYTIVPYDPQGASKGKDPDIIAFRLSVGKGTRLIRIRALDSGGAALAGSERQIRIVGPSPYTPLLLALALCPLLAMVIALALRARSYTSGGTADP